MRLKSLIPSRLKGQDSTEETFTRTQSLSKSIQGADGVAGADGADGADGANGRPVRLTADRSSCV
jgi:hypothetical protein